MILLPDDSWEIKTTAKKGRGIFTKKDIPAGTVIGDYIGKVIRTAEEDTIEDDSGLYLLYYHDYASIYPTDPQGPGIHLLNHTCMPNAWMYTYKGHTLYFALRHIFKGEELSVAYLLSPDCNPCTHICKCDYKDCNQTMHLTDEQFENWNRFNEVEEKKTKRERIRYGKELPKLASYPESIPDHPIYTLSGSFEKPPLIRDDKKLPTTKTLRKLIRETGRTIQFTNLKTRVLGIANNEIIAEAM